MIDYRVRILLLQRTCILKLHNIIYLMNHAVRYIYTTIPGIFEPVTQFSTEAVYILI